MPFSPRRSSSRHGGQQQDAERLIRQAEIEAPRHPLVLNQVALRLLRSGNSSARLAMFQELVAGQTADPETLFNYAVALRQQNRIEEALAALDRLLTVDQTNISVLLEKGALLEQLCKPRAAAEAYHAALQTLPPGFRPPPWMEPQLRHAREALDANNRELEAHVTQGLEELRSRFRSEPLNRFNQTVDIMLQKRRVWRQQPSFMYYAELPAIEFYPRELFPWLDELEAAAGDIRAEFLAAFAEDTDKLVPYVADPKMSAWRELNYSRKWSVYPLWRDGTAYPDHIARCPKTVAAVEKCPRWYMPGTGPTALFSILDAKAHIPAHTGATNTRLLCHLALVVPPACRFRVGGQVREWVEGNAFVFDDTINHEAWNDSDVSRAVLIFDVWNPFLSEAERELTRALTQRIGEFYGRDGYGNSEDRLASTQ